MKKQRNNLPGKHKKRAAQRLDDIESFYALENVIGTGSFGVVRVATYRAKPELSVAVKTLDRRRIKDQEELKNEIDIMSSIDHPNIIKYYEYFEDPKYIHIIMEYCSGGELFEKLLHARTFNEATASMYMGKILRAVNHLHLMKICHRDLKPQNFMFENDRPDAELKLIDFGLSNRFGNKMMESFVGTPYYVAPEVIRGSYGAACDLWSCGVIMYVMLSGKLPFKGDTEEELYRNIIKGAVDTKREKWLHISQNAKDLISKLLNPNPKWRISAKSALAHPWFIHPSPAEIDPQILTSLASFSCQSKIKGLALSIMVKYATTKQIRELRAAFNDLDKGKTGYLTIEEVKNGLEARGIHLPVDQMSELFRSLDLKGDGRVNYSEFLAASLSSKTKIDEHMLWTTFRIFDSDNSGYISQENLVAALKKLGHQATQEQIEFIIQEVDLAQDGRISFEEFQRAMLKT